MRHNLGRIRQQVANTPVWAVVKADAYGHGLLNAMRAFDTADGLALIEFDRAACLRQAGWNRPILMLEGAFDPADIAQAAGQRLTLVVHHAQHLAWLAAHQGPPIDIYLKINSGLNRLGFVPAELPAVARQLATLPTVRLQGALSHFANADVAGGAAQPLACFDAAMAAMAPWLPAGGARHCLANSAAVFSLPASWRDAVRPGIALYGASPFSDQRTAAALGLRPAMRLHGSLLAVQQLQAGDSTGYSSLFVAPRPMRIGIVNCGYADGYPRLAPTGTPVVVGGVRTRTLGRVSMDMLAVDLAALPEAGPGTPVELWGEQVAVDEVAAHAGTLGYELLCAVAPRVCREVE